MTLFGKSEIFFVNGLGLPFHSGTVFAFVILLFFAIYSLLIQENREIIVSNIALSVVYMMIGFSCWLVIPIRANANPPMNLNDPDNALECWIIITVNNMVMANYLRTKLYCLS
jgi:hypothetical protein